MVIWCDGSFCGSFLWPKVRKGQIYANMRKHEEKDGYFCYF